MFLNQTQRFSASVSDYGTGVPGLVILFTLQREVDGQWWDGSVWTAYTELFMVELDPINLPGYYYYDFVPDYDTVYLARMFNPDLPYRFDRCEPYFINNIKPQMQEALITDTYAEPTTAPSSNNLKDMLNVMFHETIDRVVIDGNTETVYKDDGKTSRYTRTVTSTNTAGVKSEVA
jgi:hypothetical protein